MATKASVNPYLLCITGAVLMAAGFLMGPFPVLIFAGLAPAFAIADHAEGEFFWNKLELVAIVMFAGYFGAHGLGANVIVPSIVQSIAATLAFAAFSFTRESIGRLGRIPLLLFLLTIEYLILKAGVGEKAIFLADALKLKADWTAWTSETGYLGISLWILISNHLLYLGALRQRISVPWLICFLCVVLLPIVYSYSTETPGVSREMMLQHYGTGMRTPGRYEDTGEWIPRTAAWVSALILLFAFVKSYTKKK